MRPWFKSLPAHISAKQNLSFDVVDDATATIDVPQPRADGDRLGVVAVRDDAVVDTFVRHFEALWKGAVPLPEER